MRDKFIEHRFQPKTLAVVEQANAIIAEYEKQGFTMTLRQLYYQLVSRDLMPNNRLAYQGLSRVMGDARDAGLIDWAAIEDHTRQLQTHSSWSDPAEAIRDTADWYQEDLWLGQRYRPEVWIEKAALAGIIAPICTEYRVPYFALIGNCSHSEQYKAGQRFAEITSLGAIPLVLHLGDHDPNGIDMTRDVTEKLERYAREPVEVRRLALNMDQVRRYNPPPNYAKESDSRYAGYVKKYGKKCWELDALSPAVIADLIRQQLTGLIDAKAWKRQVDAEKRNKAKLKLIAEDIDLK
jgi:hypothetical protein